MSAPEPGPMVASRPGSWRFTPSAGRRRSWRVWLTLGLDYSAWVLTVAVVALPMAATPQRMSVAGAGPLIGDTVGS